MGTLRGGTIRRIVVSGVLAGLLLVAGVAAFRALRESGPQPERYSSAPVATVVRVMRAVAGRQVETLRGYGRARALREAVVAAEITGVVEWISPCLEPGTPVTAGLELLRVDRRDADQAVLSAEAVLQEARVEEKAARIRLTGVSRRLGLAREELELGRRELSRMEELAQGSAVSPSDLDAQKLLVSRQEQAVAELEQQEAAARETITGTLAAVQAAGASLARMRHDLQRTVVNAPFDGILRSRAVQVGMRVMPGTELFQLFDPRRVEVPVALPASRFRQVDLNAEVLLQRPGQSEPCWRGVVERRSSEVNPRDLTFEVYVVVEEVEAGTGLPPGAFVEARIQGPVHEDVVALPRTAMIGRAVFLAERLERGQARVHRVEPEIAAVLGDQVLVSGGLPAEAEVVITNVEELADGALVSLVVNPEGGQPLADPPSGGRR